MNLIRTPLALVALVALVATACRGGERPTRCPLEPAIRALAVELNDSSCNDALPRDCIDVESCAERVRTCVLDSVTTGRAFSVMWNELATDSHDFTNAIVGRPTDHGYELRWLSYAYSARCGPPSKCVDRAHEGWAIRSCAKIVVLDPSGQNRTDRPEGTQGPSAFGLACDGARSVDSCSD